MTTNVRKNIATVTLSAAAGEFLQYRIQVKQGSAMVYGWSDDNGTAILPPLGSPAPSDFTWQLKSSLVAGKVQFLVPQNATYVRNETSPMIVSFALVLLFPLALSYTLTIDHLASNGTVIQNLVDIDFTGNQGDQAPHVEVVQI